MKKNTRLPIFSAQQQNMSPHSLSSSVTSTPSSNDEGNKRKTKSKRRYQYEKYDEADKEEGASGTKMRAAVSKRRKLRENLQTEEIKDAADILDLRPRKQQTCKRLHSQSKLDGTVPEKSLGHGAKHIEEEDTDDSQGKEGYTSDDREDRENAVDPTSLSQMVEDGAVVLRKRRNFTEKVSADILHVVNTFMYIALTIISYLAGGYCNFTICGTPKPKDCRYVICPFGFLINFFQADFSHVNHSCRYQIFPKDAKMYAMHV